MMASAFNVEALIDQLGAVCGTAVGAVQRAETVVGGSHTGVSRAPAPGQTGGSARRNLHSGSARRAGTGSGENVVSDRQPRGYFNDCGKAIPVDFVFGRARP